MHNAHSIEPPRELSDADVPHDRQLFSIGMIAQLLQISPADVRQLAGRAGAKISLTINDVVYYDGDGVGTMLQYRRDHKDH